MRPRLIMTPLVVVIVYEQGWREDSYTFLFIVRQSQPQNFGVRTFISTTTMFPTSYYTSTMFITLYCMWFFTSCRPLGFVIVCESIYIYWFTFTKPAFPNATINLNLYLLDPRQLYLPRLSPFSFKYIKTQQLHYLISHGSFNSKKA